MIYTGLGPKIGSFVEDFSKAKQCSPFFLCNGGRTLSLGHLAMSSNRYLLLSQCFM